MTRLVLVAASVLVSGCATMNVGAYVDRYADFTGYRTYDWSAPDALPTGDPRLDNNVIFMDYFQGAVYKELAARGYEPAIDAPADLVVHYHSSVRQRVDVAILEQNAFNCADPDCRTEFSDFDEATLVLDFMDARTQTLVWHGWAQTPLNGILESQDALQRIVVEAVTRMLKELPPAHPRTVSRPLAMAQPVVGGWRPDRPSGD